jgi:hypothetical protein
LLLVGSGVANFALGLDCSRLERGLVSVTRVPWVTQVLLQLQHESKFLLSTVWVKLWGPASAAVFLGMLLVLLLNLVRGFVAELLLL